MKKKQIELGEDAKKPKKVYVSQSTIRSLEEAKKNLHKLQKYKKTTEEVNEVWYRMMVDYWESRYYIEQMHGERDAAKQELEMQMQVQ